MNWVKQLKAMHLEQLLHKRLYFVPLFLYILFLLCDVIVIVS